MTDLVQVERADLRRLALRRHVRLASGGGEVPNGGSCMICKSEWGVDSPEGHARNCPLAPRTEPDYDVPLWKFILWIVTLGLVRVP